MTASKMGRVVYLHGKNFKGADLCRGGSRETIRKFKVNSINTTLIFTGILPKTITNPKQLRK